ncbi:c-type cytochrome [Thermoflexibacter ruber]|uniref:Cytochrome c, mono-and diheme variants n=1 Tax=Thermoflexibacter ruber TaxID=1003 RepID=A0A1I2D9J9_9BACT|nr:c-type cytochrome [Thermoflexibacter ruber]SFE76803.1 Cytochrome c, mono-and diheme variants [Thermoflexibacter ruber]
MKKIIKFVAYFVGSLLLAFVGLLAYVALRGIPSYTPEPVNLKVEITPERVAHGAKLSSVLCGVCHGNDKNILAGKLLVDIPKEFGTIYAANITQHPQTGIGKWTDGEIARLLRTGVRPDGQYIPNYMPKFVNMSDEDLASIIAYLRSDLPAVQAYDLKQTQSTPSFLVKLLCNFVMKPNPMPQQPIIQPDTTDIVRLGRYLVAGRYDCYPCHSADFTKINEVEPEKSLGYLGGGNMLYNLEGKEMYTANITMDEETGIGTWTEEEFVNTLRYGKRKDGTLLKYPMLPYPVMTETEAKAIFAYLKTVPKIKNQVKKNL